MELIDQLGMATRDLHAETDDVALVEATPAGYRDYLRLTYSFVVPSERAILATPGIERHVDVRRFRKGDLLRRDLTALRITAEQIDELALCSIPIFELPEQALGWAYLLERSTLQHAELFRHVASTIPGEVAFASSYLKCYVGRVGDMWRSFGLALEVFADNPEPRTRLLEAAKAAFHCHRTWRALHDPRTGTLAPRTTQVTDFESD